MLGSKHPRQANGIVRSDCPTSHLRQRRALALPRHCCFVLQLDLRTRKRKLRTDLGFCLKLVMRMRFAAEVWGLAWHAQSHNIVINQ